MRILDKETVEYLVVGSSILGTGGGGDPKEGLRVLLQDLERGKEIRLADLDEIPDSELVVTPYFAGSIGSPEDKEENCISEEDFPQEVLLEAIKTLEEEMGSPVGAVIPTEIGGGNTAIAFHIAGELGIPVGDGDHVGRSVPDLVHSVFYLRGRSLTPSVVTTASGDLLVFRKYSSIHRYEEVVRSIAASSGGNVFVVDTPIKASEAREIAVKGSISRSIELGKVSISSDNPAEAVASYLGGKVVLRGKITNIDLRDEGGFLLGSYCVESEAASLKIMVKNENIAAWWNDGRVAALPPDLICLIDENGWGVVNSSLREGMSVSVVLAPGPSCWRTPEGLRILGPEYFGIKEKYVPVEKILGME